MGKKKWELVFSIDKSRAIRNEDGLICIFTKPSRFTGQDERYERELSEVKANAKLIVQSPIMYKYILKQTKKGCKDAKQILATLQ